MDIDGAIVRLGSARMVGSTTVPLEVALPKKPRRVMLNYYHDVLEQEPVPPYGSQIPGR
jgi:hypothetical protein